MVPRSVYQSLYTISQPRPVPGAEQQRAVGSRGKEGGGVPAAVLEAAPARPQLDQHAARQWEVRAHACTWGRQPRPLQQPAAMQLAGRALR